MEAKMQTNHDERITRKPSKQRRISKRQKTVTSCLPHKDEDKEASGFIWDLLGSPPVSIRLCSNRQGHLEHALTCLQTMLANLLGANLTIKPRCFDKDQWREIHGFLVLQLGSVNLRSCGATGISLATQLCRCLREVYRLSLQCRYCLYSNGELQVAFATIADRVSDIFSMPGSKPDDHMLDSNTTTTIVCAFEVMRMLVKHHDLELKSVVKVTTLLVRLQCDYPLPTESPLHQNTQGLLRDLASCKDESTARAAQMSQSVIHILQQDSLKVSGTIFKQQSTSSSNKMESLLYVRCLAHSRTGADRLAQNVDILDTLVDWAIQPVTRAKDLMEFGYMAAENLSFIAIHRSYFAVVKHTDSTTGSRPDRIMDALLRVLTGASELNVKYCVIPGLLCCQPDVIAQAKAGYLQKILSCLSLVATFKSRVAVGTHIDDQKRGAAKLLLDIIEPTMSSQSTCNDMLSYTDAMSYVKMFLTMDSDPCLQDLALTTLSRANQWNPARVALHCPSVLNKLGALFCSPSAASKFKQVSMEIFDAVTGTGKKASSILARQPKVLDALVTVVAGPCSPYNQHGPPIVKQMALNILMRLSQDVCNRRILAKHVGVLACMIRYARTLSNEQLPIQYIQQAAAPSANIKLSDLKVQIMELAVAI